MKKNLFPFLLIIACLPVLISCKKNFLEIEATDRISEQALLADSSLFENFVTNRYIGARLQDKEGDGTNPGFGRGFEYAMWSSLTDESIYNNDDNTWLVQRGLLAPENSGIAGTIWARSYRSIRECNWALANIATVTMSADHKSRLTAELRFIRAYRYQDLVRNYGGIVLMGDQVYNLSDDLQDAKLFARATLQESMNYVLTELDAAAAGLPINNGSNWLLGRATRGAALGLKSRLTLYAASPLYNVGTWAAAVTAAQGVISLNKYGLYAGGYANLFLDASANNNETIFARIFTKNAGHTHLEIANGANGYGGWGGNLPLQNLVDDYQMDNGKPITDGTSGYDAQNPYVNRDPRFYATILYNGSTYRGAPVETFTPGGKDSKDGPENWNTSKTGYYLRKFMNESYPLQNPWGNAGFQPWYYIRYAEILLNFAEASNEANGADVVPAGSTLSARTAVNLVRARANMPALPAGLSQTAMRDAIRSERRVELAFEEHRFYDVRRWKIAEVTENKPANGINITKSGTTLTYSIKVALDGRAFAAKHYWLPIPRAEIQASKNQIQQNTGY
jgi:starch-binding outer membrane protein, SusD/RagB family